MVSNLVAFHAGVEALAGVCRDLPGFCAISTGKRVKYFIDALVSFTYVPMRLVSVLGIASALTGFMWAVIVVPNRILAVFLCRGGPP